MRGIGHVLNYFRTCDSIWRQSPETAGRDDILLITRHWKSCLIPGLLVAAALSAVVLIRRCEIDAQVVPTVGRVEVVSDAAWWRLGSPATDRLRTLLHPGDSIGRGREMTTHDDVRVAIRLASGYSVRMDEQTHLRFLSDRILVLDRGAVYVDSGSRYRESGGSIEIRTSLGRVWDIGTQFEVRTMDAYLLVRIREGSVSVKDREGLLELEAGYELTIDRSGKTVRRRLAPFAREWSWIAQVTPPMDLEGRSLREFLDWMARERGLSLEFATQDLPRIASKITLSGSIKEMTLDHALASVLETCGMTYRIESGSLVVKALADGDS